MGKRVAGPTHPHRRQTAFTPMSVIALGDEFVATKLTAVLVPRHTSPSAVTGGSICKFAANTFSPDTLLIRYAARPRESREANNEKCPIIREADIGLDIDRLPTT
jgi:hypothetical protein